jgi:hypothetical protein
VLAMTVHLVIVLSICVAGHLGILPGAFDGGGIASFASDSRVYQLQVSALETTLKQDGTMAWLRTPAPPHVKLYSLSSAAFSPFFGQTILSVEPLNLFYYLATLLLIFRLGRETYGEREGLLAATMFAALVPSFLLHTTQLLKDPLFIVLTLLLTLVSVKWLTTEYTFVKGLVAGALGGVAAGSLWLVKNSAWWLILTIIVLGGVLCVAQQARRRSLMRGNLAGIALTLLIALGASHFVTPYWLPKEYWTPYKPKAEASSPSSASESVAALPVSRSAQTSATSGAPVAARGAGWWSRVAGRIGHTRAQFIELYPDAGSNVDTQVQFDGAGDVVRYLPRALVVGLCAPFPSMWFGAGENVGTAGRLLSGGETLLMYLIVCLAFQSLWHRRRQASAWLLMLIALMGTMALGMVVVNVGALYRQRYLFWILFVVVGAETVSRIHGAWRVRRAESRGREERVPETFRAASLLK